MSMDSRTLRQAGIDLPVLGLGAGALGNLYRPMSDEVAQATLEAAIGAGLRLIDTAPHYGQGLSERRVGACANSRDSLIRLSTKVGRVLEPIAPPPQGTERHGFVDGDPFEPIFDYSYDGVMRSFTDSLRRLNRDRVDILLAHDLGQATHGDRYSAQLKAFLDGGYRAMSELRAEGLTRAIGLGVNEWQVCEAMMAHTDMDVFLLAGRYTLLEQGALKSFLPACQARGIGVMVGGAFNSGILATGTRSGPIAYYNYAPAGPDIIARVERIERVCSAHGVPLAAAALQFPLAHPAVVSVVVGLASPDQLASTLELHKTFIPDALWSDLKTEGLMTPDAPTPRSSHLTFAPDHRP